MAVSPQQQLGNEAPSATEHFDVIIVGAGLAGIGAARHLKATLPEKSFAVLEARDAIGGTWDLFRYPGIRSDSDMHTFSYGFRPWPEEKAIADGASILRYIKDTAREEAIEPHIRTGHHVTRAEWSTDQARWTLFTRRQGVDRPVALSCNFLLACTGYYRYDQGFRPDFPGAERFRGQVIHPQHWPEQLDYAGKRVIVVGSGATAVTLVPSMAAEAEHVTMLQRSPTYIVSLPAKDRLANRLRRSLPDRTAASIARWKNLLRALGFYQLSRRWPGLTKALLRKGVEQQLPRGYDIATHFSPDYNPWDQRVCLVPDGDLFKALREGSASIVTDHIKTFTETGLETESGRELKADVIITATGLNLTAAGGIEVVVDGRPIDLAKTISYRGVMLSGIPNLAFTVGYINSSWTLKTELVGRYVCRLLTYMDEHGYRYCQPRDPGPEVDRRPFLDLSAGYVLRSIDKFPQQGTRSPWRVNQNYLTDLISLRCRPIADPALIFL